MTRSDSAVFKPTTGRYYRAPVGTAIKLADIATPGAGWTEIGHTSAEDLLSITSDGGEATVLGTLQNSSLRTQYSNRTETMSFTLQQFDLDALKLYFGSNASTLTDTTTAGWLTVPATPTATQIAFLVVFDDGVNHLGFYAPKAEVLRGDDISLADTESFAGLPLAVKPLQNGSNTWAYAISPLV